MRFICDVHLPFRLVKFLATHASAVHVNQILDGSSTTDSLICQYADQHDYIVVTKNADFRNSYLIKQTPRKLIRFGLGNVPNDRLIQLLGEQLVLIDKLDREGPFHMEINSDNVLLY